jgi:hypothetical protein
LRRRGLRKYCEVVLVAGGKTARKDDAQRAGQRKEDASVKELLPWALAFVAFVIIAFFALQSLGKTKSYVLDGMRVEYESSMGAQEGLDAVLSKSPQIVRLETYNASDSRNSMVAIIAAEVIRSIAYANRTVSSYAAAYEPDNPAAAPGLMNCNENNSNCGAPTIVIRYGSCNCLRILPSEGRLEVEGDSSFATAHAGKVGQIIAMTEAEIANSTSG